MGGGFSGAKVRGEVVWGGAKRGRRVQLGAADSFSNTSWLLLKKKRKLWEVPFAWRCAAFKVNSEEEDRFSACLSKEYSPEQTEGEETEKA